MEDSVYKQIILDHYHHPKFKGELNSCDVDGSEVNPLCGDSLRFQFKLGKDNRLAEVAWQGQGCAISLAAADLLAEQLVGKTLTEIRAMTNEDMLSLLGIELKPSRVKCATLALVCAKKLLS